MSEQSDLPCFLDFEASSLDGFPIQVAWSLPNGSVTCHLIDPAGVEGWGDDRWDEYAEQEIHHISRDLLSKEGLPPVEVAEMMNAALEGETVYCDGGLLDQYWLEDLFEAAGIPPLFVLGDAEAMIFGKAKRMFLGMSADEVTEQAAAMKVQARDQVEGPQHRADNDVRYLQRLYQIAAGVPA